jgi:hypothetical protein
MKKILWSLMGLLVIGVASLMIWSQANAANPLQLDEAGVTVEESTGEVDDQPAAEDETEAEIQPPAQVKTEDVPAETETESEGPDDTPVQAVPETVAPQPVAPAPAPVQVPAPVVIPAPAVPFDDNGGDRVGSGHGWDDSGFDDNGGDRVGSGHGWDDSGFDDNGGDRADGFDDSPSGLDDIGIDDH